MSDGDNGGPRCVALAGPYLSGKTTLLESLLAATGAIATKGTVSEGNTVGNASAEARAREMTVEVGAAHGSYLGDEWRFLDCPGSSEFAQESLNACAVADAVVVVCDPDPTRAVAVSPVLNYLEKAGIPHILFINKMDECQGQVRDVMAALQEWSSLPLVLRQVPIREGESISGYVDLVSERAYRYEPGKPSELIPLPDGSADRASEARNEMLESLADFNDTLLEQLLEEQEPETTEVYAEITRDFEGNLIVPVVLGAALKDHGVRRLLKLLRHEVPTATQTAAAKGLEGDGPAVAQVFKTAHVPHAGKMSYARVWRGDIKDGMQLGGQRVSGMYLMQGGEREKITEAGAGDVVALGRMDEVATGDVLTASGEAPALTGWPDVLKPVYAVAVGIENHADEVKLSGALQRLAEEDPSLVVVQEAATHQLLLKGQGEVHLQVALDRLKSRYNLEVTKSEALVPYQETIRKTTSVQGRFKRQTGGHGQFGDVHVDIRPLPRGEGFVFEDKIFGGHIPKQFIPAVEAGIKEYMVQGPLGFPEVDFAVTLTDGSYHSVDSSEMAFKQAARVAMTEGLPKCQPVLLEPIHEVRVHVPSEFTAKIHGLVSGRRGQLLGFDARPGWKGWDEVVAHMPRSEIGDLIIEMRSLTQGIGSFEEKFDHMAELTGAAADKIVSTRAGQASAAQ